jgi:tight adherence protein C
VVYLAIGSTVLATLALYVSLGSQKSSTLENQLKPRNALLGRIKVKAKFNSLEALMEIPDFASILWFAVSAGEPLDSALRLSVSRSTGYVSSQFERVLRNVDHGSVLLVELQKLAADAKSEQLRELATKLAVSLNNGSALADLMSDFIQSSTAIVRSELLTLAGKNETKMMIPMVFVILPVTVMFALYPSLALIQGSFL